MTPNDFAKLIPVLQAKILQAVEQGIRQGAEQVATEAKAMIGHNQSGWPPLAEATIERKQSEGYSTPSPLLREGKLRASIQVRARPTSATVGSNDPEAVIQEHGNSHVPPRPFLSKAAAKKAPEIATGIKDRIAAVITSIKEK